MDCCFRFLLVQTDVRMTQACCQQFHLNLPEQFDFVQTVSEPKRIRQKHTITNPDQVTVHFPCLDGPVHTSARVKESTTES